MKAEQLAVVQGWSDTRAALVRWQRRPFRVLGPWALGSLAVAVALLAATYAVALLSTPDPTGIYFPGTVTPAKLQDFGFVLYRNGLVLALHAMACVAGLHRRVLAARGGQGLQRASGGSCTTAPASSRSGSCSPRRCSRSPPRRTRSATAPPRWPGSSACNPLLLMVGLLPHALPELFALFLPLAAWMLASRRGRWNELLAATFVTVAFAVPILVVAAVIETLVSPHVLLVPRRPLLKRRRHPALTGA